MPAYRHVLGLLLSIAAFSRAQSASVLMISVDGMKPEYVTEADRHGLKIPYLRSLVADGAFAAGVTGVWPTNTYPSHTTLLTGVSPAEHGIFNNQEFDPRRKFAESWFWYSRQIRVPTLWQAAHRAGLATASVGWPVSVGASDVDFLIPEYWRISRPTADLNASDRDLMAALSRPPGMLDTMQQSLGPYLMGNDTSRAADEIKTRFAIDILRVHKPRFTTVHLSSLDDAEHEHGPFSSAANEDLEALDGMLQRLATAARDNDGAAIVVVVSDHGFIELTHRVNLYLPFIKAGLIDITVDPATKQSVVTAWKAQPWMASGMAAVMLRDPADRQTLGEVRELLDQLKLDPTWGIESILEPAAIKDRGAFPEAAFLVVMQPGYYAGGGVSGDAVTVDSGHGGHGFAPENAAMRAAFFMTGKGIARHRDLELIDMRRIAPTVAAELHVPFASATGAPLTVRQ